jgi:type III secretion protein W
MAKADDSPDPQAFELMRQIVTLCSDPWVSRERFLELATQWAPQTLVGQIRFLTELKRVLRELPLEIFRDNDARLTLLSALQDALDELINTEEPLEED